MFFYDTILVFLGMTRFIYMLFFSTILLHFSCGNKPEIPDVSHIDNQTNLMRFETDLYKLKGKEIEAKDIESLRNEYGKFFDLYVERMIRVGRADDPSIGYYLSKFLNDEGIGEIFSETLNKYPNTDKLNEELNKAFKLYVYYLDSMPVPKLYTFVSGLNYAIVADSNMLGIGLDMYLGKECKYYPLLGHPTYKIKNMDSPYIVSDAILSWLSVEFEEHETHNDLIGAMIHYGKLLYVAAKLLPETSDTILTGYTANQLEWCTNNEKEMWTYLVNNNLLFTQEKTLITKFMGESPFTPGFPEGSPGRTGHWIGWQIVSRYMKNNSQVTLPQLLRNDDYHGIFNQSKYKP